MILVTCVQEVVCSTLAGRSSDCGLLNADFCATHEMSRYAIKPKKAKKYFQKLGLGSKYLLSWHLTTLADK